jgi:hypothetical protein
MPSIEVYQYGASPQRIRALEGTATQTFEAGDLVKWEAAGRVVIATGGNQCAIALNDATGTAGTAMEIELLDPVTLYVAHAASGTTTDQADVGAESDFTYTAGAHTLASNTTAGSDAIIVDLHPADGAKLAGRYIIRFMAAGIATGA